MVSEKDWTLALGQKNENYIKMSYILNELTCLLLLYI